MITTIDTETLNLKATTPNAQAANGERAFQYADWFKRQREPDRLDLIKQFKHYVYVFATLNSDTVATYEPKLYVKTNASQRAPRVPTKELSQAKIAKLLENPSFSGWQRDGFTKEFAKVEEVIRHPILDLFRTVNSSGFFNQYLLFKFTQLYLEVVGSAYWFIESDFLQRPQAIWLLPSQFVEAKTEPGSKNYVDYYEYNPANGGQVQKFLPEEILHFRFADLNNPYTNGLSPTKAAWETVILDGKLRSHLNATLDSEARPDAIISAKEGFSSDQANNLERKFNLRFGKGRSGGIYVAEEEINFVPIEWPIRDIARLEINKFSKVDIANIFGVPIALAESTSINRAVLEAAQIQYGRYAIRPRQRNLLGVLNSEKFLGRWDNSGRLLLLFDDPVPEDEAIKLQKWTGLVQAGIAMANEAREDYHMPPHPDGNKLQSANQAKAEANRDQQRTSGESER